MEWLIYIISPMQTKCKICKRFVDSSSAPRWRRYCLPSVPQRLYRRHLALFIVSICPSLLFCAALLASAERIESSAHRTKSQNGTLARPRRHTDLFFFAKNRAAQEGETQIYNRRSQNCWRGRHHQNPDSAKFSVGTALALLRNSPQFLSPSSDGMT